IAGEKIPLAARIVAVADVYDALSVRRIYKDAFPHEECVKIIRDETGKQFDPEIVEAFMQIEKQFERIAQQFSDRNPAGETSERFEAACERYNRLTPAEERVLTTVLDESRDQQSEEFVSSRSA
ncbi:MAG: HD-GYP domain-containing protein, partial [Planctomycetaceae bacterium]